MADPMNLVLMVLHITVAATAFAVGMSMSGAIRRATGQGAAVKRNIAELANRTGLIATIFGVLTLATGLALIFYRGGFKVISPTIHAAMGLVVIMLVLGQLWMRPTGHKLLAAVDDDAAWGAARKRWVMGDGIMQLLWLVTLVLMFIKRG